MILRYDDLGLSKAYTLRPDQIDVLVRARNSERALSERIPLLLREGDVIHLDYGRCPAEGMGNRVLGVVTQRLGIERGGKHVLEFDFGAPTSASLKPAYDADGFIRAELNVALPAIYFGRTGYRVMIGE